MHSHSRSSIFALLDLDYTFWLNEAKANSAGACPISLRLTKHGKRTEVSTQMRCLPSEWNAPGHRLRRGRKEHPLAKAYNLALDTLEARVVVLRASHPADATLADFRNALRPEPLPTAKPVVPDLLAAMTVAADKHYLNASTHATATGALNKLRRYVAPALGLLATTVTPGWAASFTEWVNQGKGAAPHLNMLRALHAHAFPDLPNPFTAVRNARNKQPAKPRYVLSEEELRRMEAAELPKHGQRTARDIYLAQYYLHGSRLGVVLELRWEQIDFATGRVQFLAEKGGGWHSVALHASLASLLHSYCPQPTGYVFPLLPADFAQQSSRRRYILRHSASSKVSRGLKAVGKLLKFNGHLHSHSARHTLATHTVEKTGSFRLAQQFLGHGSMTQTERYVKPMLRGELDAGADVVYGR